MLDNQRKIFLIADKAKTKKLIFEKKLSQKQIIDFKELESFLEKYPNKKMIIDRKTCSLFYENLFKKKLKIYRTQI